MRTIQELCKEIAEEMGITPVHRWVNIENRLKMREILPEIEWKESGVTCLASRPMMGKSALAEDILLDAAMWMQKPVVYFSLGMTEKLLVYRLIRKISGVDCRWKIREEEIGKVEGAIDFLADLPIVIDDTPGISVSKMETVLQEMKDAGMVIVDYIRLMTVENYREFSAREEEVKWIMKNISRISRERSLPFLTLSQLPRDIEFRKNKRPCLDDLCRALYDLEDVDSVIFLYREGYYRGESYRKQTGDDSAEIILAKSKSGITKTIRARLDEEYFRFCKNDDYDFVVQKEYNGNPIQYAVIHGEIPRVPLYGSRVLESVRPDRFP